MRDGYGNTISTGSAAARDAYVRGTDLLLAAQAFMAAPFEEAVAADPGFALGHAGLARARQFGGDLGGARAAIDTARGLTGGITGREAAHVNALGLLIEGRGPEALAAIREHVAEHPRDAIVAQTCTSVFGLIGFSGQPGREAEMLAFNAALLPHYGEDWWCLSQYAFALCETGQLAKASTVIDRSLALNPANANAAHVRSHVWYEEGDAASGIGYLADWVGRHDRNGMLHGHLSWHVALWSLERGDVARMWAVVDADVAPGVAQGQPINVLTDTASILCRAELAGVEVPAERWRAVSAYAAEMFPRTGNAFVDVHAALAHAMAGNGEALERIVAEPAGPAADLVPDVALAWRAMAAGRWAEAARHLVAAMADHARIGGSRAQRDLLELSLVSCLLRQGRGEEARDIVALRRPVLRPALPH